MKRGIALNKILVNGEKELTIQFYGNLCIDVCLKSFCRIKYLHVWDKILKPVRKGETMGTCNI